MRKGLAGQRLVAVFLVAALLFNYPVVSLFDRVGEAASVWVPAYLFLAWAAVIAAVACIVERGQR